MALHRITKSYTDIHANLFYSHIRCDVICYFRSAFPKVRKTVKNAASYGFESNISGAAFCLPPPTGGLFVMCNSSVYGRKQTKNNVNNATLTAGGTYVIPRRRRLPCRVDAVRHR